MTSDVSADAAAAEINAEVRRRARDRELRRRFADTLVPGLPVDGDVPGFRVPAPRAGTLVDGIVRELLVEKSAFFDDVTASWKTLAPGIPARPGRFQDGRLFLYVRSSSVLFSLRSKLPKLRRALAALATAPKRFTLHLEIH